MKFFKHFADAHEGKSMMALMNEFGLEGYAAYFILVEMFAKKLEKESTETFTEDHLKFTFNERLVREKLRMRSTKVELYLNYCVTLDLLQFSKVQDELHFFVPKLLESMDRDSKRARAERDVPAPKKKIKKKKQEEDKDKEKFVSSLAEYLKLPGVTKGQKAEDRFAEQIKSPEDFLNLNLAITNYQNALALPQNAWRKPKQTFETFLGTKSSGYFWKDWIELPSNVVAINDHSSLDNLPWEQA